MGMAITDDDIKKLKTVFATKQDFKRLETRFSGLERRFGGLEERFGGLERRFGGLEGKVSGLEEGLRNLVKDHVALRSEVEEIKEKMATKDDLRDVKGIAEEVLGEVKAMREEQAAHNQQHEDTDQRLDNHERRLKKLESPSLVAHQIKR